MLCIHFCPCCFCSIYCKVVAFLFQLCSSHQIFYLLWHCSQLSHSSPTAPTHHLNPQQPPLQVSITLTGKMGNRYVSTMARIQSTVSSMFRCTLFNHSKLLSPTYDAYLIFLQWHKSSVTIIYTWVCEHPTILGLSKFLLNIISNISICIQRSKEECC